MTVSVLAPLKETTAISLTLAAGVSVELAASETLAFS